MFAMAFDLMPGMRGQSLDAADLDAGLFKRCFKAVGLLASSGLKALSLIGLARDIPPVA